MAKVGRNAPSGPASEYSNVIQIAHHMELGVCGSITDRLR